MSRVAVRSSQRLKPPPVRSDLKSHNSNRKAKQSSNRPKTPISLRNSHRPEKVQTMDPHWVTPPVFRGLFDRRLFKTPKPSFWETEFYTPPVLGGAAPVDNSAPAVYEIQGPEGTGFLYTAGAELSERAAPPSNGVVHKEISLPLCQEMGIQPLPGVGGISRYPLRSVALKKAP